MQLVINLAAVFVSAISPFLKWNYALKVTHLLWINLCMDSLASIMFAGEPALKKYMRMKPRRRDESIISKPMAIQIVIMSLWLTVISILWFVVSSAHSSATKHSGIPASSVCLYSVWSIRLNVRSDGMNIFEHLSENKRFVHIWLAIMAVQVVFVSIGGIIGEVFSCQRFGLQGWLVVCAMALTMYPVDLIRKALTPKVKE